MPRRTSQVAEQLSAELKARGENVSPRQVERLGEAGLLGSPLPDRPELLARAQEALAFVRHYGGRHDFAVLAMFVRGRYVGGETRLKRAYSLALERMETAFDKHLAEGGKLEETRPLAAAFARRSAKQPEARALRDRVKRTRPSGSPQTMVSLLEDFYTELNLLQRKGRTTSDQGMHEVLEGLGVAAVTSERFLGLPPFVASLPIEFINDVASQMTLGGIVRRISLASYEQLEQARDDALALASLARELTPLAMMIFDTPEVGGYRAMAEVDDIGIALALPAWIVMRSCSEGRVNELRANAIRETRRCHALNELFEQMPEYLLSQLRDPERIAAAFTDEERAALTAFIDGVSREHWTPGGVLDQDGSQAKLLEEFESMLTIAESADALAEQLDTQIGAITDLPEGTVANAGPLLFAFAEADLELGEGLARWCVANPDRPLAQFGGTLLAVLSSHDREATYGLLEGLRAGDVSARRQLADYLGVGTWFGTPDAPETGMLRELVADKDLSVVYMSLQAVLGLAQVNPALAIDIAIASDIHAHNALAETLCMVISRITEHLRPCHVPLLLDKLRPVPKLDYQAQEVLSKLSPRHRDEILGFLLDRAGAGGEIRGPSDHANNIDLLGGAIGEELLGLLRRVRDAVLKPSRRLRHEASGLYWRLATNQDAALTVLLEWLTGTDEHKVDVVLELMREMPWQVPLTYPQFVEATLNAAHERGTASLAKVGGALLSIAVIDGDQSRTMSEAPERHIRLRDDGRELAERFAVESPARQFYETVVARAEASLCEAELEDEEHPELGV